MRKISAAILVLLANSVAAGQQKQQKQPPPHFVTADTGISVHLHQPQGSFVAGQSIEA